MTTNISTITKELRDAIDAVPRRAAELRDAITAKQREIDAVKRGYLSEPELHERVADVVRRHGESFAHNHAGRLQVLAQRKPKSMRLPDDLQGKDVTLSFDAFCLANPAAAGAHLEALIRAAGYEPGLDAKTAASTVARLETELADLMLAHERIVDEAREVGITIAHLPETNRRREAARQDAERQQRDRALQQQLDAAATPDTARVQHTSPYLDAHRAETAELRRAVDGVAR